jgi:hypothetical protein
MTARVLVTLLAVAIGLSVAAAVCLVKPTVRDAAEGRPDTQARERVDAGPVDATPQCAGREPPDDGAIRPPAALASAAVAGRIAPALPGCKLSADYDREYSQVEFLSDATVPPDQRRHGRSGVRLARAHDSTGARVYVVLGASIADVEDGCGVAAFPLPGRLEHLVAASEIADPVRDAPLSAPVPEGGNPAAAAARQSAVRATFYSNTGRYEGGALLVVVDATESVLAARYLPDGLRARSMQVFAGGVSFLVTDLDDGMANGGPLSLELVTLVDGSLRSLVRAEVGYHGRASTEECTEYDPTYARHRRGSPCDRGPPGYIRLTGGPSDAPRLEVAEVAGLGCEHDETCTGLVREYLYDRINHRFQPADAGHRRLLRAEVQ